jgi:membrane-bound ClpP family serine protease
MSTGIVFAPIFLGLVLLFYDAKLKWGWALFYVGLALIMIEILSRIRFQMGMPVSNLLLMLGMIAAGIGMMLRSFRDAAPPPPQAPPAA